jgi:hypothetical protein
MREASKLLATISCGMFFGAAIYISLVQHPATLATGNDFAVRFFPLMYRRAAVLQATLALVGCAARHPSVAHTCGPFVVARRCSARKRGSLHTPHHQARKRRAVSR